MPIWMHSIIYSCYWAGRGSVSRSGSGECNSSAIICQCQNLIFLEIWFSNFKTEGYTDSDFASRGGRRVTRYADHCPVCSLDLRKILSASKADDSADLAAGPTCEPSTVLWWMCFLLYVITFGVCISVGCFWMLDYLGHWVEFWTVWFWDSIVKFIQPMTIQLQWLQPWW